MQFSVTFRHMDPTQAIKDYAREKIDCVRKYFPDPIAAHVVFSTERGYQHQVDVNIQLHNGLAIKGRETTEDMYSSIDLVMAKIERQVRRYKDKIRAHKARADLSSIPVQLHTLEEQVEGEDAGADELATPPTAAERARRETTPPQPKIIRTQRFHATPLTPDEAVMQMNLLGNAFLVFLNSDTGQVAVVYKRDDGTYGLIEPGAAPH